MTNPVVSLARTSARHPVVVVVTWVLLALAVLAGSRALGSETEDTITIPGSDSAAAAALLGDEDDAGGSARLLVASTDGRPITDADHAAAVGQLTEALSEVPGVADVADPLADAAAAQKATAAGVISSDGQAVLLTIPYAEGETPESTDLDDARTSVAADGITTAFGNPVARDLEPGRGSHRSEVIGIAVAIIVLLVALRSLVAMSLPIAVALVTVVTGLSAVTLLSNAVTIPQVASTLGSMIGLGVGIDYTLFQLVRHRAVLVREARAGRVEQAATTAATSGSAVAFAGLTVAIAICGLAITGVDFVSWLGFATAIVVLVVLVGSLTLTPALLALLAPALTPRRRAGAAAPAEVDAQADGEAAGRADGQPAAEVDAHAEADERLDASGWSRFARRITARPIVSTVLAGAVLVTIGTPVAFLHLGQTDLGDSPAGTEQRDYFDLTAEHFGPGETGPFLVAVALDPAADPSAAMADPRVSELVTRLGGVDGVAEVRPSRVSADGSTVTLRVVQTTVPSDPQTAQTLDAIRTQVLADPTLASEGVSAHVGGATATRADLADRIIERLPWLIGIVVAAAALLLVAAFRSIALPIKAAVMDLVSVAAAYGVVVAVFEWGWGSQLLGLDGPIQIDSYVPMMMFAVLFGLSMDYEVFLLTAIREHHERGATTSDAVRRGLAETGGIITAAALIMVAVFGSFVIVDDPVVKIFGVGLAVAVVVDATLVRCVLAPAVMVLLGEANWWLPRWVNRALPRLAV